jgi:hypothetical protein
MSTYSISGESSSPAFETAAAIEELSIVDVVPILMTLAGCPVPARTSGEVPPELLRIPSFREEYAGVEFAAGEHERSTDGRMRERLEDLGYL